MLPGPDNGSIDSANPLNMRGNPMNPRFVLPALLFTVATAVAAPDVRFALPSAPLELMTNEAKFRPFALLVGAEVERLLGVPAALDDPATLKLLLSTRVHLAHHFADNEKAIATAAWIRSLQTDPAGRAFAGLTTLAAVEARQRHPGAPPDDERYRQTFFDAFERHLATLPHSSATLTTLRGQRVKIGGITLEALLAEARDVIAALSGRNSCSLVEADQLVRVRHRLESILPVRDETLRALDAAIVARETL